MVQVFDSYTPRSRGIMKESEEIEVIPMEIPPIILEIIKQQGQIIETHNHIIKRWALPPMFVKSGESNEETH